MKGGQTGDQTDTSSNNNRSDVASSNLQQTQNAMRMDEIKSKTQRITSSLTNTTMSAGIVGISGGLIANTNTQPGYDKFFSEIEANEGSRVNETEMTKGKLQQ